MPGFLKAEAHASRCVIQEQTGHKTKNLDLEGPTETGQKACPSSKQHPLLHVSLSRRCCHPVPQVWALATLVEQPPPVPAATLGPGHPRPSAHPGPSTHPRPNGNSGPSHPGPSSQLPQLVQRPIYRSSCVTLTSPPAVGIPAPLPASEHSPAQI